MPMSSVASMRKPRAEGTGGGMSVTEKERKSDIGRGNERKGRRGKSVSGIEGKTEMFGKRIREREGGRGM